MDAYMLVLAIGFFAGSAAIIPLLERLRRR